jgi:hypothetical protein
MMRACYVSISVLVMFVVACWLAFGASGSPEFSGMTGGQTPPGGGTPMDCRSAPPEACPRWPGSDCSVEDTCTTTCNGGGQKLKFTCVGGNAFPGQCVIGFAVTVPCNLYGESCRSNVCTPFGAGTPSIGCGSDQTCSG